MTDQALQISTQELHQLNGNSKHPKARIHLVSPKKPKQRGGTGSEETTMNVKSEEQWSVCWSGGEQESHVRRDRISVSEGR